MTTRAAHTDARISAAVRGLMAARQENQTDLGLLLGVSRTAISERLAGRRRWLASDVAILAEHWGVDEAFLMHPPADLVGAAVVTFGLRHSYRAGLTLAA